MRWLNHNRVQERGAVAVIVAIVAGGLVLTGVAALAVDAGSLYAERRVVQNGADASALALAQACVNKSAGCSPTWPDLANLANLNSPDGLTDIESVCGSVAPFSSCGTLPVDPSLVQCTKLPPNVLATSAWVEVRTKTRSAGAHTSVVPKFFANLFTPGYNGEGVKACARAAWGPVSKMKTAIPVTFSQCEWKLGTGTKDDGTGTTYGNAPPFTTDNPMTPAREVALALNAPKDAACSTWAGHDLPGGFGWICHDSSCSPPAPSACSIAVDKNGWIDVDTGIGGGSDCKPEMNGVVGKVIYMPVFECRSKTKTFCDNTAGGTKSFYKIRGFAAFFVTGVDIVGGMDKNFLTGYPTTAAKATCTAKGGKCIYGWFVNDYLGASAFVDGGSFDFGLTAVQAAG